MSDSILQNVQKYQESECKKIRKYIIDNCSKEEIKELLESFGVKCDE